MPKAKLNKTYVDGVAPGAADVFHWDVELKGFAVRVSPKGVKTYIAQYRAGGGRKGGTRRFAIGRHGTLTADEARRKAKQVLGAAAAGQDPSGDKTAARREMTVTELINFYAEKGTGELKTREARQKLARLRHHVMPTLGRKKLSTLLPADINGMIKAVTDGKTAKDQMVGFRRRIIVKGGRGAAAKVVRDFSAVCRFAKKNRLLQHNPCSDADKPKDGKRKRFLTLDELRRLGAALKQLEAEGANRKAILIIKLWVLTGCRRNEIMELTWAEVDASAGRLSLVETKEGDSSRPMASAAAAIIESIARTASPYVFPSERGATYYQGVKRVWDNAMKLAGLADVTPHTLRHTIGSAAVSTGESLAMTGAILGHADPRSTQIYAHVQQHPAQAAIERVVAPIANALSGQPIQDHNGKADGEEV